MGVHGSTDHHRDAMFANEYIFFFFFLFVYHRTGVSHDSLSFPYFFIVFGVKRPDVVCGSVTPCTFFSRPILHFTTTTSFLLYLFPSDALCGPVQHFFFFFFFHGFGFLFRTVDPSASASHLCHVGMEG